MAEKVESSFVNSLVSNPDEIPDIIFLSGFVGASSLEGYTRLYLNVVLSEFFEIPSDAVLHTLRLPLATSPFGETVLWVKKDAELIRKGKSTTETKAKFFSGEIQQNYVATAPANGSVGPTGVLNCTQSPETCGNTVWPGCPPQTPVPEQKPA